MAELQEILGMGQSRISTHLAQLKQAGLVEDRRNGKSILYRLKPVHGASRRVSIAVGSVRQAPTRSRGRAGFGRAAAGPAAAQDKTRSYFDELAGKFGRHYMPGRSWKGLAETVLALLPPLVVADLGAGEGTFSQLLAQRAKKVIAVDNSEKMVEYGWELARKHGVKNLGISQGRSGRLAARDASVDLAFFRQSLHHAQHPERAVAEAWRILKPGGRIVVLDLVRHNYEEAREMYADLWLGFTEVEALRFLRQAGFKNIETSVVHREEEAPHFETLLAIAEK